MKIGCKNSVEIWTQSGTRNFQIRKVRKKMARMPIFLELTNRIVTDMYKAGLTRNILCSYNCIGL